MSSTLSVDIYIYISLVDVNQILEVEMDGRANGDAGDQRGLKDMSPYLLQLERDRDSWAKGEERGH